MTCPICGQKPANCDCSPRERAMWRELREREGTPPTLSDEEQEAVEWCIFQQATPQQIAVTLRRLMERLGGGV